MQPRAAVRIRIHQQKADMAPCATVALPFADENELLSEAYGKLGIDPGGRYDIRVVGCDGPAFSSIGLDTSEDGWHREGPAALLEANRLALAAEAIDERRLDAVLAGVAMLDPFMRRMPALVGKVVLSYDEVPFRAFSEDGPTPAERFARTVFGSEAFERMATAEGLAEAAWDAFDGPEPARTGLSGFAGELYEEVLGNPEAMPGSEKELADLVVSRARGISVFENGYILHEEFPDDLSQPGSPEAKYLSTSQEGPMADARAFVESRIAEAEREAAFAEGNPGYFDFKFERYGGNASFSWEEDGRRCRLERRYGDALAYVPVPDGVGPHGGPATLSFPDAAHPRGFRICRQSAAALARDVGRIMRGERSAGLEDAPESLKEWYLEKRSLLDGLSGRRIPWGGQACFYDPSSLLVCAADDFRRTLPAKSDRSMYAALARAAEGAEAPDDEDIGEAFELEPDAFWEDELPLLFEERPYLFDDASCAKWPELARAKEAAALDSKLGAISKSSKTLDAEKNAAGRDAKDAGREDPKHGPRGDGPR